MADAAVEFLLENLNHLFLHHAHLISDAKNQVEKLENDLRCFEAFLRDPTLKKRRKYDDSLRELVRQIRDVVYEAEDIIDALVTQAAESKSKNYFLREFQTPVKLLSVVKDVESIGLKVRDIYGDKSMFDFATSLRIAEEENHQTQSSHGRIVRQNNVMGFEDEAKKLIEYLKEETELLDVISIIGMPGQGKTTLARQIFRDPKIRYEFPTLIWVYISQEFTNKYVFLSILSEFTTVTDDMYSKTDQELAHITATLLHTRNFLIVMDDVWTTDDWDKLQIALPKSNKKGKVLITSRHVEVARYANRNRDPHQLRLLTSDESWLLLRLEVFGKPECPSELEVLGRIIVDQCHGLPLAIAVIGGILFKKFSATKDMDATKNAWRKVSDSLSRFLDEDPTGQMEKIIALSYAKLPYHLRACFLYFAMFPEDYEIPVWKLIRMWIAEGFIQQRASISLEETAENYLHDLIDRNLVRIDKTSREGKVKTCRIHDMLRDFCKMESGIQRENFLQEIKRSREGSLYPMLTEIQKYRRICIHSNVLSFLSSKPYGNHVRSFVCFSKDEIDLPRENIPAIPAAFKLLRVLEAKPIIFISTLPRDLYHLLHLRYLTISFDLATLPEAFSKLWNLQTLIVGTTSRTLEIKANIWKMNHLRHFKTNASATLPMIEKSDNAGEKLQTLGNISPQSCNKEIFYRARNVKRLGIRGRLAMLLEAKNVTFERLGKLSNLEKLKLLNDVYPSPPLEGRLRGLLPANQFPPKLRSLTLSDTLLDWTHMSIIGLLENLEVLKLKHKAFMGRCWEVVDGGFCHLEALLIENTNLVTWIASGNNFPRLRCLELRHCDQLQEVPLGLADIPTFQMLDLYRTELLASSAQKIMKAKQNVKEGETAKINVFKLSIFPPEE